MNLSNYPLSTCAYDVECYYGGTDEMLDPKCKECGAEVIAHGILCPPCVEGVAEFNAIQTPNNKGLNISAAIVGFVMALLVMGCYR